LTTTVLLDLDDTLLGNNMDRFLPPYFAALERRLRPFAAGKEIQKVTMTAIGVMLANQDPTVTNMEAFMAEFTAQLGQPADALWPVLDAFYEEDYPTLKQYTTYRPEAPRLVDCLLAKGYKVVIATNPFFPAVAINQRLDWAGIGQLPYAWITTMENSSFSKPDPRYYQHILHSVGGTPDAAWMIGNDLDRDIIPTHALGLKTWWIINQTDLPDPLPEPTWDKQGSLADVLAWVESW
jgi:FMN phosphatase YigB (HAD superfamily)